MGEPDPADIRERLRLARERARHLQGVADSADDLARKARKAAQDAWRTCHNIQLELEGQLTLPLDNLDNMEGPA